MLIHLDQERAAQQNRVGIMACGLTGSGKSTLLNIFLGEKQFKVGEREFDPSKTIVVQGHRTKERLVFDLYDTPGNDNERYEGIISECSDDVDLLVYCISASSVAGLDSDSNIAILKKLKSSLNETIWKRCVVALTFSNTIAERVRAKLPRDLGPRTVAEEFEQDVRIWKEKVYQIFRNAEIDVTENNIPVVPVGAANNKILKSDNNKWSVNLCHELYDRSPPDGKPVLHYFLIDPPFLQKLKVRLNDRFPTIAGAVGAGGAAGVAGAGIGATIGALAIGIPTFGVAAGVGLVLGGVIGGGVGVGVGAVTGTVIEAARGNNRAGSNE